MVGQLAENRISSDQNSQLQLSRLAAASQEYGKAKRVLGFQVTITVLGGIASSLLVAGLPALTAWAAFYAFTATILDAVALEDLQSKYRDAGAKIQELFDSDLLQLPWRAVVAGDRPAPEAIEEESVHYRRSHADLGRLTNWYSPAVSQLPLSLARLVCQRTNAWWDSTLRTRYIAYLKLLLFLLTIFVVALALHRRITMDVFVTAILAPLTPAILWGVREIRKHSSSTANLTRLQAYIDAKWQEALDEGLTDKELYAESMRIQDQIFRSRSTSPLVFNWVYSALRGPKEQTMQTVSTQLVTEALSKIAARAGGRP